ncbi:MAG: DNA translocase FtsK [Nitrospirae bacterium]|nr:DNA translocase FtsK [Nitrospirota bacterium]MBI3593867.1 DNA translocase FtsK [Nitrospirota bacterium]
MKTKRKNEIKGVLFLTLSLFLLISLISYDPHDPSFTTSGKSMVSNLIGLTGSYLSDILLSLFGVTSYLLPVYLFIMGIKKLRDPSDEAGAFFNKWNSLGTTGLFFSLPAALNILLPKWPSVSGEWILLDETGGMLGKMETHLFSRYFGDVGSYLATFSLLLLSMMFLTHFSPWRFGENFIGNLYRFLVRLRQLVVISILKTRKIKENARKAGKTLIPKPKPKIVTVPPPMAEPEKEAPEKERVPILPVKGDYQLPPLTLLDPPPPAEEKMSKEELEFNAQLLKKKLLDFGIEGNVSEVHPGPVITLYEFEPAPGIKVNQITNLSDDLALAMKAMRVRIVAPIPGKAAVGIEIPNRAREVVSLKQLITPQASSTLKLPLFLGKDISGQPVTADFTEMPHLLVAGATGSGKSVALNSMVLSLLFSKRPSELKMMMIDPKMLELTTYNDIPHLIKPVITQPREAAKGLQEIVLEMQRRYKTLAESGVRNIEGYHKFKPHQKKNPSVEEGEELPPKTMPYLVIIIDELADLMMTSQKEVEESIGRLAQMGRASGIHLLLATQRPSVDVLTGVIKANFPARISFQVSSKTDSRTILDANGAEQLLGKGDMLYLVPGTGKITRIHGPYVSEDEIKRIVSFIKAQEKPNYDEYKLPTVPDRHPGEMTDERDDMYEQARELVISTGQASASLIQRRLRVGYPRAARMIEMMQEDGVVGPANGAKQRQVLIKRSPEE